MNARRTLVFAVLAAALGAYIYLVEKPRMDREAEPDKVLAFNADQVAGLKLVYEKSDDLLLERDGDDWRVRAPLDVDADDPTVERLLEQIEDAKVERRIASEDGEPLATYGLEGDGTRARIEIKLDDGSALPAIIVGKTTPVGYSAFARVEGRKEILVTPLIFHSGVHKTLFDVRNKRLFHLEPDAALSLALEHEGRTTAISRKGTQWIIDDPPAGKADKAQVHGLLSALNNLNAIEFFDADVDEDELGLSEPTLRLTVELPETGSVGFVLGKKDDGPPSAYYLRRNGDGQVAKIDEAMRNRFAKDLDTLRDKHLFHCRPAHIGSIRFERSDGDSFSLLLGEDGGWKVEPPSEAPVREGIIERTRNGLATLAGQQFVAEDVVDAAGLAVYGLDAPVVEVEIESKDGESCGRALAGIVAGDGASPAYYVKRAGENNVMSLPEYLFSRLDSRRGDFLAEPAPEAEQGSGGDE